jgi:hypothetical protein
MLQIVVGLQGWMMGPFLIYAALLNGAAMAIFTVMPLTAVPLKILTERALQPSWSCIRVFVCKQRLSRSRADRWGSYII